MKRQNLLLFELGAKEFGIDLSLVEEVVPAGMVTPLPNAPAFLAGLTAVRGRVLSVIDCAKRYGFGPTLNGFLLVCAVRGNMTAITVDRAFIAGNLPVRELDAKEKEELRGSCGLEPQFVRNAFELFEERDGNFSTTGKKFLEVNPDLFISDEMAARVGDET